MCYAPSGAILMVKQRQIEAFRAVILTGGITAASELMHVSQPAVSRLISDLQYAFGLRLFERRGSRLVPTFEALSLYREVERFFVGLDRIAQVVADLRAKRAGALRVAALPALASGFLPRFATRFLAERPKLDLALFSMPSRVVLDWVAADQCDIGFTETPIEHPAVTVERLEPATAVAAVPAGHRLARKRRLRPEDFANETFISLGQSTLLRFRIDATFAERHVPRQLRIEAPAAMIACGFVAAGAGLSVIDPFTAAGLASQGVAIRPFEPRIDVECGVIHLTERSLSDVAREFIDGFRNEIEQFGRRTGRRAVVANRD